MASAPPLDEDSQHIAGQDDEVAWAHSIAPFIWSHFTTCKIVSGTLLILFILSTAVIQDGTSLSHNTVQE